MQAGAGVGKQGRLRAEKGVGPGGQPPWVTHPRGNRTLNPVHVQVTVDVTAMGAHEHRAAVLCVTVETSLCAMSKADACLMAVASSHGRLLCLALTALESPQSML